MATKMVFEQLTGQVLQIDFPDTTNFSFYHVKADEYVTVKDGQEMVTTKKKLICDGTLVLDGQVSLI